MTSDMALTNRTCFQVNLRDELKCRVCGRAPLTEQNYHRGFGYHHVQFQSHGGSDEPENVILLCAQCHTRLHQQKLDLPPLGDLTPPPAIFCHNCATSVDPETVEMNCGWYKCETCHHKVHLFDHCGYCDPRTEPDGAGTRRD